ncbi:MAG TPA: anti-sigma regulatory factor [Clostridia bacterium]|nr:anti-sigma regulatory factor [Clostridia bacterium]
MTFAIEQRNFKEAGEASSKLKNRLIQLGFPGTLIRRVAIATYEAEMNLVIHSKGGTIEAEIKPGVVKILVVDVGPGIIDLNKAMKTGFSTAPEHVREMGFGAGMGLPNMRSCASEFAITSELGTGTTIKMVIS